MDHSTESPSFDHLDHLDPENQFSRLSFDFDQFIARQYSAPMPRLFPKRKDRPISTFSHSQIIPDTQIPIRTSSELPMPAPAFDTPDAENDRARPRSVSPVSVPDFPVREQVSSQHAQAITASPQEPPQGFRSPNREADDSYDLKPPPPSVSGHTVETMASRLFSVDHLNIILRDATLHHAFHSFLMQHRPSLIPKLAEYIETQKAIAAVDYANAVADHVHSKSQQQSPHPVASVDPKFRAKANELVTDLVLDGLPAYVTHRLTRIVTDSLVKEITGQGTPLMRDMIPSLAEVYCVTDPSLVDNPIVYASEEFYNATQYGMDFVIGRNCRFLQGPRTARRSVDRLIAALKAGQEVTETMLNYRRDGSPFLNLLLIAPLYDNKGAVRYFLGCQIDVSSLIEGGRGLESFEQLLSRERVDSRFEPRSDRRPLELLSELGALLGDEEAQSIKSTTVRYASTSGRPGSSKGRIILGADEQEETFWPHPSLGPSGRLPGVYQNYLLVRPFPSLRITFTSPALRIPGLLQSKLMDCISSAQHVRDGIVAAFTNGTSVTAKVSWVGPQESMPRPRWIHCTPLLGSDSKVGVWMVVMVEREEVTGSLGTDRVRNGSVASLHSRRPSGATSSEQARVAGNRMYQDYVRREGRGASAELSRNGSVGSDR